MNAPLDYPHSAGHFHGDRDDVISLMTGIRSRQNSYCSHGSRWSYSSHVEQSFANMRSASGLGDSSTGTRSCRNSLLINKTSSCHQCNNHTNHESSLSEDASLWPPDYLVRYFFSILLVLRCIFCLFLLLVLRYTLVF